MPELPEVETIKNDLAPLLVGRVFTDVTLYWPRAVLKPSPGEFRSRLVGQAIKGLERRGKYLVFRLCDGEALILHLRMSGSLLLRSPSDADGFVRTVFHLDNGQELRFSDVRKMGVMWLVKDEKDVIGKLGPEPFDLSFTPEAMAQHLSQRSAPIKSVLMDQSFVAGLGNIYADEALFEARIHPGRRAKELSYQEVERLHQAIRSVLEQAIANRGTSISNYVDPAGRPGSNQYSLRLPRHAGEPCTVCHTYIERLRLGGRSAYFCPRCQANSGQER
jgi:formamidopyrimidine-DNA glycosylase